MDIRKIPQIVERHKSEILEAERYIWKHPETGYHEWKTSAYMAEQFEKLGYTLRYAGNIPGFTTVLDTGRPGPCVLVMGELDSLICADHPECDPETKAVHACGHNAQCAGLLGIAYALKEPGMLDELSGKIMLCAVPAEELIELEKRVELRKQGIIRYMGGKVEFLYRGYFDECDLALLVHTSGGKEIYTFGGSNGCVVKKIEYIGKAAHAGGDPQDGINALYAASLGMQAVNSLRETFPDEDHVRFHPIINKGGDAVNAIPADVVAESYVRGASLEAIVRENAKVNRALAGAAVSMGAQLHLNDCPGYAPLNNDSTFNAIADEVLGEILPAGEYYSCRSWSTGCTDMGDMSTVMPTIQPYAGGAIGQGHGKDYFIADPYIACVKSAAFQTALICRLLENDAVLAKKVKAQSKCLYASKEEYFAVMDKLFLDKDVVEYREDGISIRI